MRINEVANDILLETVPQALLVLVGSYLKSQTIPLETDEDLLIIQAEFSNASELVNVSEISALFRYYSRRDRVKMDNDHYPWLICSIAFSSKNHAFLHEWLKVCTKSILELRMNQSNPQHEIHLCRFFRRIALHPDRYDSIINTLGFPGTTIQSNVGKLGALLNSVKKELLFTSLEQANKDINLAQGAYRALGHIVRTATGGNNKNENNEKELDTNHVFGNSEDKHKKLIQWLYPSKGSYHAAKRAHHFPGDISAIEIFTSNTLCTELYKDAENNNAIASAILLALLTGKDIEFWINEVGSNQKNKSESVLVNNRLRKAFYKRSYTLPEYELKQFQGFYKKTSTENNGLPIPYEIVLTIYQSEEKPTVSSAEGYLKEFRNKLKIPRLHKVGIKSLLKTTLKRQVANRFVADILCGTNPKHSPALNYTVYRRRDLMRYYQSAVSLMTGKKAEQLSYIIPAHDDAVMVGSHTLVEARLVSSYLRNLQERIESEPDRLVRIRLYTVWIWHVLLILTAARVVSDLPGLYEQIDLEQGLWWVSDKEERTNITYGRFVPLCKFLTTAISSYIDELMSALRQSSRISHEACQYMQRYERGELPIFAFYDYDNKWKPVTYKIIKDFNTDLFDQPKNWTRHYARWHLQESGCDAHLIDAIFGHETAFAEMLNPYSSFCFEEYNTVRTMFDQLAIDLKLTIPRI